MRRRRVRNVDVFYMLDELSPNLEVLVIAYMNEYECSLSTKEGVTETKGFHTMDGVLDVPVLTGIQVLPKLEVLVFKYTANGVLPMLEVPVSSYDGWCIV